MASGSAIVAESRPQYCQRNSAMAINVQSAFGWNGSAHRRRAA
jgi:hypothetical protein